MVGGVILKPVTTYIQTLTQKIQDCSKDTAVNLIGISRGGFWLAEQILPHLPTGSLLGELDISFYRDDFSQIGLHPQVKPSNIPFEVEGTTIILLDDIIRTGRTIRAALNEIFDYGRPAKVILACVFELTGRELPIRPDIVVQQLDLAMGQRIKLQGPENLEFKFVTLETAT